MDQKALEDALSGLGIGSIRYYDSVTSTNDLAQTWAKQGAPDLALVAANKQTAGKGRAGRAWSTPPGTALAFSLVLRPGSSEEAREALPRLGGVAGLAVASTLQSIYKLQTEIKWPNDVLLQGKKVCGILAEADWVGNHIDSIVLGIGINVLEGSVPPASNLRLPATSIEAVSGRQPNRLQILAEILQAFKVWRSKAPADVISAWEAYLAYKDRLVRVDPGGGESYRGRITGLDRSGYLQVETLSGKTLSLHDADGSIRLVDSPPE
jgi:BirA family biotin operon repressor/biotin-[acetyl-CoA-carboxylase] ligase